MLVFSHSPFGHFRDAARHKKRQKMGKIPTSRDPPNNSPQPLSLREIFRHILFFCLKNFFLFKVKHVLAPQDDFAKLCKQTEKNGIWSDPPVPFWNFSHFFPFFSDRVPYKDMISWWWTDHQLMMNQLMMNWWWNDDELMMHWCWANDELMIDCWWTNELLMSWWCADDQVMMIWW